MQAFDMCVVSKGREILLVRALQVHTHTQTHRYIQGEQHASETTLKASNRSCSTYLLRRTCCMHYMVALNPARCHRRGNVFPHHQSPRHADKAALSHALQPPHSIPPQAILCRSQLHSTARTHPLCDLQSHAQLYSHCDIPVLL